MRPLDSVHGNCFQARLVRQQAVEGNGGQPPSLLDEVRRTLMGRDNLDMTTREFLLHRETELQEHVSARIREYEAMLTVIGYLSGAIDPPPPMTTEGLREQVADAIREAGGSLIERSQRTMLDNFNPLNALSSGVGVVYGISGGVADLLGFDETAEGYYDTAETALNTDVVALYNNAVNDLVSSIWEGLSDYWDRFWETADREGFLIAYGKLRIDAGFLAAELAIDIALGAVSGGAAAAASRVVRVVGRRVAGSITRVTVKIGRVGEVIPDNHRVLELDIDDADIPANVERLIDEDNLGGASQLDDTAQRAKANPTTANTAVIHGGFRSNQVEWKTANDVPVEVNARLNEIQPDRNRSSTERKAQADAGRSGRGLADDDGGHVIGHRFTGDQGPKNLFPQQFNFNRGAYKAIEDEWERAINAGYEVQVNVKLTPPGAARPDKVEVRWQYYDQNGNPFGEGQRIKFNNAPGQKYDSTAFRD